MAGQSEIHPSTGSIEADIDPRQLAIMVSLP
jgi:hypothetical protein